MSQYKNPKRCEICRIHRGPWHKEDVYPLWLRRYVLDLVKAHPGGWMYEPRPRILLNTCDNCQKRLARRFEHPASRILKTMMDGLPFTLTASDQQIVASWAVKTDLLSIVARKYSLRRLVRPTVAPPRPDVAEYCRQVVHVMITDVSPPPNTLVRLAYFTDRAAETPEPLIPPGWPRRANDLALVICIPNLVFEIIIGSSIPLESFIDATKCDQRFVLIWPPNPAGIAWPPATAVTPDVVQRLRDEWGHSPDDVVGKAAARHG